MLFVTVENYFLLPYFTVFYIILNAEILRVMRHKLINVLQFCTNVVKSSLIISWPKFQNC